MSLSLQGHVCIRFLTGGACLLPETCCRMWLSRARLPPLESRVGRGGTPDHEGRGSGEAELLRSGRGVLVVVGLSKLSGIRLGPLSLRSQLGPVAQSV